MARGSGTRGFWRGLLTGLLLAAAAGLALAWLFPPLRPPEVAGEALVPPEPLAPPGAVAEPPRAGGGGLLPPPAGAPLVAGRPAPEASPKRPAEGASLVPLAPDGRE
jgi:hypothetical protein